MVTDRIHLVTDRFLVGHMANRSSMGGGMDLTPWTKGSGLFPLVPLLAARPKAASRRPSSLWFCQLLEQAGLFAATLHTPFGRRLTYDSLETGGEMLRGGES